MSRRRRPSSSWRWLAPAALSALLWQAVTHWAGASDVAAAAAVGAVWGLLGGWRTRGAAERVIRRLINRLLHRAGYRIVLSGRRGRR